MLLPGGAMNLLTKWIHGQRTWEATLRAVIDQRTTRTLDAGSVDNQMFFCALLAGASAKFAQAREDVRMGDFGRALQDARAAVDAVHHLELTAETCASGRLPSGNIVAALVGPLARTRHMDM